MTISIGKKIKELRKERLVTQEQLASFLGVTPQAVSRWESEYAYPDIELLPSISDFFSVSTDELLGVHREKRELRILDIKKEIKRLNEVGSADEGLNFARKVVAEFPSEESMWLNLADQLHANTLWSDDPDKTMLDEAEQILRMLLETTKNDSIRYNAIMSLTSHYSLGLKDNKRALEMVNRLPKMQYCREAAKSYLIQGEECELYMQDEINILTDNLGTAIMCLVIRNELPNDETTWNRKISMLRTAGELYKMIYGDDLKFYHIRLAEIHQLISAYQIAQGKVEETLASLEEMCHHSVAHDEAFLNERGKHYTSPFVNKIIYSYTSEDFYEREAHNSCWYQLDKLSRNGYDCIRDNERFKAVISELERCAK